MSTFAKVNADTVWFYCNHKAFENIIVSHELWLSDVTKSNDSNEIIGTLSLMETVCAKLVDNEFGDAHSALKADICSLFRREIKKAKALCLWATMCFSSEKDSLYQWLTYGEKGKGYAIGFSVNRLMRIINEYKAPKRRIEFAGMRYAVPIEEANRMILDSWKNGITDSRVCFIFSTLQDMISTLTIKTEGLTNRDGKLSDKARNIIKDKIGDMVLPLAFYKDYFFCTEKEARICYARYIALNRSVAETNPNSLTSRLKYTVKEGGIVPHIALDMKVEKMQETISEVMIGPNNGVNVDTVKKFMVRAGNFASRDGWSINGVNVSKSTIPIRYAKE